VIEAMALERPVVASDIPMVREAIGRHAAALVEVGQQQALSKALGAVLADPQAFAQTTILARQRFESHFTPDAVAAGLLRIYERVAARR
jgi:glycosyltransferase involved in cell wall biosynthesis